MITEKKCFTTIKNMQHLRWKKKESGDIKNIYSDHNIIILKADFMTEMQKGKKET